MTKGYKRIPSTKELQKKTLKSAHRSGLTWETYEVSRIVAGIKAGETTFEMAMSLGRSYYSVQNTRRMVRFGMNHLAVLR